MHDAEYYVWQYASADTRTFLLTFTAKLQQGRAEVGDVHESQAVFGICHACSAIVTADYKTNSPKSNAEAPALTPVPLQIM
jgi:hypothetical protein